MCDLHPFGQCGAAPSGKLYCQYGGTFGADCPSGLKWSEKAGEGLANTCVAEPDGGFPDGAVDAAADAELPDAVVLPDGPPGVPPDMAAVGAGLFKRGCNAMVEGPCSESNSLPFQEITLSDYWIDRTEVTQSAYQMCVTAGTCTPPAGDFDPVTKPDHPVERVSWQQATTYCTWVGKRLPTEAEWEKAARFVDGRKYPWGNTVEDCTKAHWNECPGAFEPTPVATHLAGDSPYGLHDMAGNVWEWVADWYDANYYQTAPNVDPTGPASGTLKVLRGGSAKNGATSMQASRRGFAAPADQTDEVGFRCARTPP
jgi:formylglycine-generating enzyme required for sulfatase activity